MYNPVCRLEEPVNRAQAQENMQFSLPYEIYDTEHWKSKTQVGKKLPVNREWCGGE